MTTIDLTIPFLIFFGIPTSIFAFGIILFFAKPTHRGMIGAFSVTLGTLELSFYLVYRGFVSTLMVLYSFMIMTILLGLISLYYAKVTIKN